MSATQVPARLPLIEEIRFVLSACQYARSARDYAGRFVDALATATGSPCAIWLHWPLHPEEVVAQTGELALHPLLSLCAAHPDGAPFICHDLDEAAIHSVAAAPVMFRSTVTGVLAVINASRYSAADLQLLAFTARTALLEYESRQQADELELTTMARRAADLAHDLRQTLGILEACTCLMEFALAPADPRAREHLDEMHRQIDLAGGIIENSLRGYTARGDASRDLANSAMSMVT